MQFGGLLGYRQVHSVNVWNLKERVIEEFVERYFEAVGVDFKGESRSG